MVLKANPLYGKWPYLNKSYKTPLPPDLIGVIHSLHNSTKAATGNSAREQWWRHLFKNKNEQGARLADRERDGASLIYTPLPLPVAITLLR